MKKKIMSSTTLVSLLLLVFGCTSVDVSRGLTQYQLSEKELFARKMPELSIATADQLLERVKVVSLLGNELSALPFPYWNVEAIKINIEKITTIKLLYNKNRSMTNALVGFNITFGIAGIAFASAAEYDRDYQWGLGYTSLLAFGGSLVTGIATAILDSSKRKNWDFTELTPAQRLAVLMKIMGVRS